MQLINGISSDLQKLLRYINGTLIVVFFKIPLLLYGAGWTSVSPANLISYMKALKVALIPITALSLVTSSFQKKKTR